jgi:hypothetical protein
MSANTTLPGFSPRQTRLSRHTRELGLKHIALIKAQLAEQARQEELQRSERAAQRTNAA